MPGNPHHLPNWIRTGYRYPSLLNTCKLFTERYAITHACLHTCWKSLRHAFNCMPGKSKAFSTQLVISCVWRNYLSLHSVLSNCFSVALFMPPLGHQHIKRILNIYETIIGWQHDTPILVGFFFFLTKWVLVSLFSFPNIKRFINIVLMMASKILKDKKGNSIAIEAFKCWGKESIFWVETIVHPLNGLTMVNFMWCNLCLKYEKDFTTSSLVKGRANNLCDKASGVFSNDWKCKI